MSSNETYDPARKPHRLILPLGLRVLVQVIRVEERTDAGLYLPAGAKEANDDALYGKVIEVARDRPTSDDIDVGELRDRFAGLHDSGVAALRLRGKVSAPRRR